VKHFLHEQIMIPDTPTTWPREGDVGGMQVFASSSFLTAIAHFRLLMILNDKDMDAGLYAYYGLNQVYYCCAEFRKQSQVGWIG
jgi:hypothetical protein